MWVLLLTTLIVNAGADSIGKSFSVGWKYYRLDQEGPFLHPHSSQVSGFGYLETYRPVTIESLVNDGTIWSRVALRVTLYTSGLKERLTIQFTLPIQHLSNKSTAKVRAVAYFTTHYILKGNVSNPNLTVLMSGSKFTVSTPHEKFTF